MAKPKADRRPDARQGIHGHDDRDALDVDKLSGTLAAAVNHQDATIDQLLAIKQIAWLLRNTAGEASLIVSIALGFGKVAPETRLALPNLTAVSTPRGARWNYRVGNAVAAGDLQADGLDQDRLFRPNISPCGNGC